MEETFKYHSQRQALEFAAQIIPVPAEYPLKPGLPEDYRECFERLCRLARAVYLDMAKEPEAYGLMLLEISNADHNLARNSYRSIQRFVDTLNALFKNGEVSSHSLIVNAEQFRSGIRKLPVVTKYGLVISRLLKFGFQVSDFNGTVINKSAEHFTVEFPEDPRMIDTIKAYCECWKVLDQFRSRDNDVNRPLIKLSPQEFHHHFYRFDYKITADLTQLPLLTWVNDEAEYQGYDSRLKHFNEAFFLEMQKYKGVRYDGDYTYKGKRIARITPIGYTAMGDAEFRLSLKLKYMDNYADFIQELPEGIKKPMQEDSCCYCGFQGSTKEYCKFRLHWTIDGAAHTGCSFWCFNFDSYEIDDVPYYARLLALEYGLEKV